MEQVHLTQEQADQLLKLDKFINARVKHIVSLNPAVNEVQVGIQLASILAGNFLVDYTSEDAERLLQGGFTEKALAMRKNFLEEIRLQELKRQLKKHKENR